VSIKSVLDNLTSEQRRRLFHAFDNGFGQYVELSDSRFIGVNIGNVPNLEADEHVGVWSLGRINK